jgi:hypothetical protein
MPQNVFSVQREEIWNIISIPMGEGRVRVIEEILRLGLRITIM